MAIHLPEVVEITDQDQHRPYQFCDDRLAADPDEMDRWAEHLVSRHGYRVVADQDHDSDRRSVSRLIRLELAGWSPQAKFQPNTRVNVLKKHLMHPMGCAGRRGTVVGWHARASEYCVAFDEEPVFGWLASSVLERYMPPAR